MTINQAKLLGKPKKTNRPKRVLPGVKRPLAVMVYYRKQLQAILNYLKNHSDEVIKPILQAHEAEYIADKWIDDIKNALQGLQNRFSNITTIANTLANRVVNQINTINRNQFQSQFKNSLGLDIFSNETELQAFLQAKVDENIQLIKSIPQDYFNRLSTSVYQGITQGLSSREIAKSINTIYEVTSRRAKFIARDQVAKTNAAITQKRQEDLGITEYVWRNAQDQRVRGNPSGLYPNSRDNHWKLEGKTIRWDSPPAESDYHHPGEDWNCRCWAQPVIKI